MDQRSRPHAIDQRMIDLYDAYTHAPAGAPMPRRVFMQRLAVLAGSVAAAEAALSLLAPNAALAQQVAPDDARLRAGHISYPGSSGEMRGYLAQPAAAGGKLPAVLVIHENRGLNPHIEDVARRAALAGFLALAPDALSPLGGTPGDADKAREMIGTLDAATTLRDYLAALAYLRGHADSTGKVGCVGFCWGGGMVNQVAAHAPDLAAGVVFYGRSPSDGDAARIKARMLLHYAGLDTRINAGVPAYEAALKAAGVDYSLHVYDGVNHAFHNDTAAARYDKTAAEAAWSRTVAFFRESLRG